MFFVYRDILGFEAIWGNEESRYAEFKAGEAGIGLFDWTAMAKTIDTESLSPDINSRIHISWKCNIILFILLKNRE